MTSARQRRHRRPAPPPVRRDPRRVGALVALLGVSALGAVAGPVMGSDPDLPARADVTSLTATDGDAVLGSTQARRGAAVDGVSRSQARSAPAQVTAAPEVATPEVVSPLSVPGSTPAFAQDDTAVRAEPAAGSARLLELDRGDDVAVTGREESGWAEVVVDGALAWVDGDDVADTAPPEEIVTTAGPVPAQVSGAPCSANSGIEGGLTSNAIEVHRAVCAAFPGLVHGGLRPGDSGEHGSGRAVDIMVTGSKGDAVAAYLQEHASELGVDNLIWKQRIWFAGTSHSAWQGMADRGSVTANHFDHVHVGVR